MNYANLDDADLEPTVLIVFFFFQKKKQKAFVLLRRRSLAAQPSAKPTLGGLGG
jgi:hypothetical protein